jgi:hypothetical protein
MDSTFARRARLKANRNNARFMLLTIRGLGVQKIYRVNASDSHPEEGRNNASLP